jgi:hypothetical protein
MIHRLMRGFARKMYREFLNEVFLIGSMDYLLYFYTLYKYASPYLPYYIIYGLSIGSCEFLLFYLY